MERNRVLQYARRTMCWSYACQQAAHLSVVERKAHRRGTSERTEKVAPTFCHKILSVHGQRDVDPACLVGAKRRNKLSAGDINVSYLVLVSLVRMSMTPASGTRAGRDARCTRRASTHLVEKVAILAEFSAGAARRPSRAVICCKTAFGCSLDELLSETHML